MESVETIERAGFTAKIYYDDSPSSPEEWSRIGTLCWQARDLPTYWRDYGALNPKDAPSDAKVILPIHSYGNRDGIVLEIEIAETWEKANGWIYATKESIKECCGEVSDEWVKEALIGELTEWNQYLQGDVYGVIIEDPNGNEIDARWGFYGLDYAIEEAKEMLDIEPVRLLEKFPVI